MPVRVKKTRQDKRAPTEEGAIRFQAVPDKFVTVPALAVGKLASAFLRVANLEVPPRRHCSARPMCGG
jgi:hypothetical protein